MDSQYDIVVIGGGFYGVYIAEYLAKKGKKILLCEKEQDLMIRASFANQARVHNGYHYPRSVLTALRSRVSFPRFNQEFKDCIDDSFDMYYMVGNLLSKVTAQQFQRFCQRIGSPYEPASVDIVNMTNPKYVEAVFRTTEYAFDAIKLKDEMAGRIAHYGVDIQLNTQVKSVKQVANGLLVTLSNADNETLTVGASQVFNCTYSNLNSINNASNIDIVPLKHEMTEICLVKVPDAVKGKAFTLMCGPFFSLMPFPSTEHYSFSHVRYTPHYHWHDQTDQVPFNSKPLLAGERKSAWHKMHKDAARYMPVLSECEYVSSLWEVKTVLPRSSKGDSRPILFKKNYGLQGFHCVMGGKIDNVYDAVDTICSLGLDK